MVWSLAAAGALLTAALGAGGSSAHPQTRHVIRDPNGFTQTFHSANWMHPPIVTMFGTDPDPNAGDIFLDAQNSIQAGPMILSPQGQLIWFDPLHQRGAYDFAVQSYQGKSVLTFTGAAVDEILDHSYQTIATVRAGEGYAAGVHDFQITPQGTALITASAHQRADLSSVGGPRNGTVLDNAVQEINITTGRVLWAWQAYRHVPLTDSYAGKPRSSAYDFFHINSIQQLAGGNLLVSARNTWTVYEINKQTGKIVWELGGRHSSFTIGPGANFEWQHDARMQPDGTITLFDDGAGLYQSESQSRALRLRVNFQSRAATLVRAYTANPPLLSWAEGNVQVLPDGNTFVGFGSTPYFAEFGPSGKQLFAVHFSKPLQSYRAFRFPWLGEPATPPAIAIASTQQATTVYASWNGATQVASWYVLSGPSATSLTPFGQFYSTGFETTMSVPDTDAYFAVEALDPYGHVLGTSPAVARGGN